jgi:hypothetical protein
MVIATTNLGHSVLPVLRKKTLENHHFSEWLLTNTVFKEFAMLSMGGEAEGWFRTICKGMKEEEEKIFDEMCQSLMADIWSCLRNQYVAKNNSVEPSHRHQVHTYMRGWNNESDFGKIMKGMPLRLEDRHAACILCQQQFLFHDWITNTLEKIRQVLCPAAKKVLETEHGAKTRGLGVKVDLSKEVNRFVGWAISNLIKKTRKQFERSKGPPKRVDEEELFGRLELLKSMRVFEHEILDDKEYIEKC